MITVVELAHNINQEHLLTINMYYFRLPFGDKCSISGLPHV